MDRRFLTENTARATTVKMAGEQGRLVALRGLSTTRKQGTEYSISTLLSKKPPLVSGDSTNLFTPKNQRASAA